jgi:putative two-component system response regulator
MISYAGSAICWITGMSDIVASPPQIKVLLIDDDAVSRRAAARVLAIHGYGCLEAASGSAARAVFEAEPDIAAMLCDIELRGESGTELLGDLAADFPDVTVVMTSAVDDPDLAELGSSLGALGYLIKPFVAKDLVVCLEAALSRHERESGHRNEVRSLEQTLARARVLGTAIGQLEVGSELSEVGAEETVERLSHAVSLRDEETGRHIERMSRFSVVLAEAVGFTGLLPEHLRLATALHDVGKIGVPDVILLKPGPLTPDERVVMQRHPQIGYELLAESSSQLLRVGAGVALAHHEWWDGSGYPLGLRGVDIPEEARIAAVADVFDALTNNRVYRPAMPIHEVVAIMRGLRGRQFEPRLVDAFLDSMEKIGSIREAYPEVEDSEQRIRVLLVDDHTIFVHSLVRLLGARPELKIVGTAGSATEAVVAAVAYRPDVILMDFVLPDGDGIQATEQIKRLSPSVNIIMLTAQDDDRPLERAITAGCSGFVSKADAVDHLFEAIVAAHQGEIVAPQGELVSLLHQLRRNDRGVGTDLTPREYEVLGLIAGGLVNKQIAEKLHLSLNTVRNHSQNILYKLNAHSKLEAVAIAVREGIIEYPSEAETR